MNLICTIAGTACLLYYAVLVFYSGISTNFNWIWLLTGGCLLILGWFFYITAAKGESTRLIRILAVILLAAVLAVICTEAFRVTATGRNQKERKAERVIVLGAQVKGTVPSRSLSFRLRKALDYAREYPDCVLILSGGQGKGEDISEAVCMKNYLTTHGIPEERLILEENSTSTRENLRFCDEMTGCSKETCGIISNDFHILRALYLATQCGYEDVFGIPAESDRITYPHMVLREVAAMFALKLGEN